MERIACAIRVGIIAMASAQMAANQVPLVLNARRNVPVQFAGRMVAAASVNLIIVRPDKLVKTGNARRLAHPAAIR